MKRFMTKQIVVMNNIIMEMVLRIVDTNDDSEKGTTHADDDTNNRKK